MLLIQMIIIQIVTFGALVYVLRRFMYTEAAKELKRLRQLNEEGVRKAKELARKIREAEEEYHRKLSRAEEEAREIKIKAKEEAEKTKEEILERARKESDQVVKAAFNAKERIRREIASQMRGEAFALAAQIFEASLSLKIKELFHQELIRELVRGIEKMDKSKFNIKIEKVELFSAFPFKKEEEEMILLCLFQKLGYKVPFDEKENNGLIAGVVVKLGTFVIDASLNNRLKRVGEALIATNLNSSN